MHRCKETLPLFIIFLFAALGAQGQISSAPFSKFGIGDLQPGGNAQNQGMGGIGISNGNSWYINSMNPALLINNHVAVFQAGMQYENKTQTGGGSSQKFKNGNLNYLAIALPVMSNRWTTSIGLASYSNVNYNFSSPGDITGINQTATYQQKGKGGLNQFYWSNGVAINKYFSVGVKATYLFGSIESQDLAFIQNAYTYSSVQTRDASSGLNFSGGVSFQKDSLFKKYKLGIGAIGSFGSTLKVQHQSKYVSYFTNGSVLDSATFDKKYGKMILPATFGIGASFGKMNRWTAGFDFNVLDYTGKTKLFGLFNNNAFDYKTNDGTRLYEGSTALGYRTGFGFEVTPKAEDFTNYLKRITYRVGGSYERSPILINGNEVTDIGGTFGFSLPVSLSTMDIGIKIGKRGDVTRNLLEENYFRIYFGVTFNDRHWFIKRKFD
jgi:hypothetical protein